LFYHGFLSQLSELFSAFAYSQLSKSAKNVSKLAKFAGLGHKSIAGFKKIINFAVVVEREEVLYKLKMIID